MYAESTENSVLFLSLQRLRLHNSKLFIFCCNAPLTAHSLYWCQCLSYDQ